MSTPISANRSASDPPSSASPMSSRSMRVSSGAASVPSPWKIMPSGPACSCPQCATVPSASTRRCFQPEPSFQSIQACRRADPRPFAPQSPPHEPRRPCEPPQDPHASHDRRPSPEEPRERQSPPQEPHEPRGSQEPQRPWQAPHDPRPLAPQSPPHAPRPRSPPPSYPRPRAGWRPGPRPSPRPWRAPCQARPGRQRSMRPPRWPSRPQSQRQPLPPPPRPSSYQRPRIGGWIGGCIACGAGACSAAMPPMRCWRNQAWRLCAVQPSAFSASRRPAIGTSAPPSNQPFSGSFGSSPARPSVRSHRSIVDIGLRPAARSPGVVVTPGVRCTAISCSTRTGRSPATHCPSLSSRTRTSPSSPSFWMTTCMRARAGSARSGSGSRTNSPSLPCTRRTVRVPSCVTTTVVVSVSSASSAQAVAVAPHRNAATATHAVRDRRVRIGSCMVLSWIEGPKAVRRPVAPHLGLVSGPRSYAATRGGLAGILTPATAPGAGGRRGSAADRPPGSGLPRPRRRTRRGGS